MKKRVITGAILVVILVLALVLRQVNAYIFDALILLLSIGASIEIANCFKKQEEDYPKITVLVLSIVNAVLTFFIFLTCLLTNTLVLMAAFLALSLFVEVLVLIIVNAKKFKTFVKLKYIFPLAYPTYLFLFFYLINHIDAFNSLLNPSIALYILVSIFVISALTDTFAMLIGIMIKGPKLCPKISPKKTISGSIGGLIFGTCAGLLCYAIFNVIEPFTTIFLEAQVGFGFVLLFSFLASLLCQIGDLFESYFKRSIGIKDTGTLLAGHGGIMDRLDGVSFVVVIMFVASIVLFV